MEKIYSVAVETAVKNIRSLQGKKNSIDTYYEYEKLGQLLTDIQSGKFDKNKVEEDSLYVMGLRVEYEKKYLGETEQGCCGSNSPQSECEKEEDSAAASLKEEQKPAPEPVKEGCTTDGTPSADSRPVKAARTSSGKGEQTGLTPRKVVTVPIRTGITNIDNSDRNSVSGDGNITITGNGNNVTITGKDKPAEEKEKEDESNVMLEKSKSSYDEAFAEGKQVAKELIGRTNSEAKELVKQYIMRQTPETIMGFLDGFMKNDKVLGIKYGIGGLIDQIDNENKTPILNEPWTKAEKKETFAKIISTTLEWAEAAGLKNGYESEFRELKSMLSDVKNGNKINTERADKLIKELVTAGTTRAGIY